MITSGAKPVVSIILATYNESAFIERSLGSLLVQQAPTLELEILVVDGMSTDDTVAKADAIAAKDPRVRVLHNVHRHTPFAWNLGLRESRGDYVCTLGAHNLYAADYIATCVAEMEAHGAVACTGRVLTRPANSSLQAKLCCWSLGSSFGVSSTSFRTQKEGFVDSPAFPVFRKDAVVRAGGWNEGLLRAEDNDMSRKLLAAGGKLYCTWKTSCCYHGAPDFESLMRYGFKNGYWSLIALRDRLSTMRPRHFVPFAFVLAGLGSILAVPVFIAMGWPLGASVLVGLIFGSHFLAGMMASLFVVLRERRISPLLLPLAFFLFHVSYGWGTLSAVCSNAKLAIRIPTQEGCEDG